jgi:AcrR family transcriptional regulator
MARPRKTRDPEETREKLLASAEREFSTRGFFGTDTNRIARMASYAPQTFYRHFQDKTEIFLAVYERWWRAEGEAVVSAARGTKGDARLAKIADTILDFHARWRIFRRSLRHLSADDKRVRAARAKARKAQIESLMRLPRKKRISAEELYAGLIMLERLADAAAEEEYSDMGFSKRAARDAVIATLRTTHR